MSTRANAYSEFKEKASLMYDWGTVMALAAAILIFELVPPTEMGSISTRTTDSEMEAVEADLAFDDTVQEQEEEVQQEQEEMQQAAEELIEQLQTDVTLSLGDSTGLATVTTVQQTVENVGSGSEEMGPPRFMPVEVFPNCTFRPQPEYPEMARMAGVEGTVTLWVFVKTDGTVGDVQLYNSSGASALDNAAIEAAWRTRWTPAQNSGIPVGVWTTVQYVFTLNQ